MLQLCCRNTRKKGNNMVGHKDQNHGCYTLLQVLHYTSLTAFDLKNLNKGGTNSVQNNVTVVTKRKERMTSK